MYNFLQRCFINKNTKEIKAKLEELGYKLENQSDDFEGLVTHYRETANYWCVIPFKKEYLLKKGYENIVDCEENEELFFAIASMRLDTDKDQYFVTEADQAWVNQQIYAPKGSIFKCLVEDRYMGEDPQFTSGIVPARKATVEEIIRFLNSKK